MKVVRILLLSISVGLFAFPFLTGGMVIERTLFSRELIVSDILFISGGASCFMTLFLFLFFLSICAIQK